MVDTTPLSSNAVRIMDHKTAAESFLAIKNPKWAEAEELFFNISSDKISQTTKSRVYDPRLGNLLIDRSARIMAQLGTGKLKPISGNDAGGAILLNLILDKYVIPNANAQFSLLTKFRMIDLYSGLYGKFYGFIDQDVKANGYVGPDLWLLNLRDVLPQVGPVSMADSDRVVVRSWKSINWFEDIAKANTPGYQNMNLIIERLKEKNGDKQNRTGTEIDRREQEDYPDATPAKGSGMFEVLSMYEKDRWVDYVTDAKLEMRDQKNPQENGELPVVEKHTLPLLTDIMGLADFERGKSLQKATNSLWNLYMDAVKISIMPPVLINKDNVADANSIKYSAAAKWLVRNNIQNVAKTLTLAPQGTSTFQQAFTTVNSSLLSIFGTTDTSVTPQTDPGFGKTPQALQMTEKRQNARDTIDTHFMELFVNQVMARFANIIVKNQKAKLTIRMFGADIIKLSQQYPDISAMYDQKTGTLKLDSKSYNQSMYDYELISGSTYQIDKQATQKSLESLLTLYTQSPQVVEQLRKEGKDFSIGNLMEMIMSNSGLPGWEKVITDFNPNDDKHIAENVARNMSEFDLYIRKMMGDQSVSEIPATQPAQAPVQSNPQIPSVQPPADPTQPQLPPMQPGVMPQ